MSRITVLLLSLALAAGCASKTKATAPRASAAPRTLAIPVNVGWDHNFDKPSPMEWVDETSGVLIQSTCCDFLLKIERCPDVTGGACPTGTINAEGDFVPDPMPVIHESTWTYPSVPSTNTLISTTPQDPTKKGLIAKGPTVSESGRYRLTVIAKHSTGHLSSPARAIATIDPVAPPPQQCPAPSIGAWTGCYYHGMNFETFAISKIESAIAFNWGESGPIGIVNDPSQPANQFSVRWEGDFPFEAGDYDFTTESDDGIRLFIGGTIVEDAWVQRPATKAVKRRTMTAGTHRVKTEYFEATSSASVSVSWARVAAPPPPPPLDTMPPSAPGPIVASGITRTAIALSWGAATDNVGVDKYLVTRNGNYLATRTTLDFVATDLVCATGYTFGVQAFDAVGNMSPFVSVATRTLDCPEPEPPPPPPPPPPVLDTTLPIVSISTVTRSGASSNYTISIKAVDDTEIQRVDLFLDDKQVAMITAPTAVGGSTYQAKIFIRTAGTHVLRAVAYDLRANAGSATRNILR